MRYALAAKIAPLRREVLASSDVERATVGELNHLLEDALAEGLLAYQRGASAILQRAGDDL